MRFEFNPRALCYNLYCDTREEHDKLKQMMEKPLTATDVKSIENMIYTDTDSVKTMKMKLNSLYGKGVKFMLQELKDTIPMMESEDYKERFKAEYYQLKIRREKLASMIDKYMNNTLEFKPACDIHIFMAQVAIMDAYIIILQQRAKIEKIDLN